jgi:NAD(P)H-nitrite reductase large subunit
LERNKGPSKTGSLTILLTAGRIPLDVMEKANELAHRYQLGIYLTTAQNLRFTGIKENDLSRIKEELALLGVHFKSPGQFPIPRVCIGNCDCNLGLVDPHQLSKSIMDHFGDRTNVKPKFKIAISGCNVSCSGAVLTDIGIMATRNGYDIYVGGKMGRSPTIGRRIFRGAEEEKVLKIIDELVQFHEEKTTQKQRMCDLIDQPDFPYRQAV